MVENYQRYAIYWRPEPGPLADFGASWLGWDPARGAAAPHPQTEVDVEAVTRTPRRYGLHATIKPPIRLAQGRTAQAMIDALKALCAGMAPVRTQGLALEQMSGFWALRPTGDLGALSALAASVVKGLDEFRAPASQTELAKRRAAGLSPRQEALLTAWGYPYVLDEFRFHITLSGRLEPTLAQKVGAVLAAQLPPLCPAPFDITHLTLLGEDADGFFHDIHQAPLGG